MRKRPAKPDNASIVYCLTPSGRLAGPSKSAIADTANSTALIRKQLISKCLEMKTTLEENVEFCGVLITGRQAMNCR